MSYRGVIFNSHFSLFEKMGYLFLILVDSFCIKIPMFFVLAEKPFLAKIISCSLEIIFLFAGKNQLSKPKKKHLCQAAFFCIFMHYFLLKFYLDFGPKNTL